MLIIMKYLKRLPGGSGQDRVVGTQGEGEEAQVVCHQVNLNVNDLASSIAPRYGPRGKAAPRHVVLEAAEVVPAHPAPPAVDGVELGCETSTVERVVVPVLREDMITSSAIYKIFNLPWAGYTEV